MMDDDDDMKSKGGDKSTCVYVCMCGHTYSKSMDQSGKVVNPARGQLNNKET